MALTPGYARDPKRNDMDQPKCRLCGKRHSLREGCAFGGTATITKVVSNVSKKAVSAGAVVSNVSKVDDNGKKYRTAEKRRIYMRDLMRRKRSPEPEYQI